MKQAYSETSFAANDEGQVDYEKVDPSKYKDIFEKPNSFEEAWNHPCPFQRKKWREATQKEFSKMNGKKVWKKIKRSDMEEGRRCVKHRWVLEIKRSGVFRARLVACGYSQIPGTDFSQVYAPVANDVSFRLLLIEMMVNGLEAMIFDIETAFLLGELDTVIYMDCPQGMDHEEDECLLLTKTIYGLVQSARQYNIKYVNTLKKLGFEQCQADPCLFKRKDETEVCFILIYVDDNLMVGNTESMNKVLQELSQTEFSYTVELNLKDYLSCEVRRKGLTAWLGQPHMIKKLEKVFSEEVKNRQVYKTPGTPGHRIAKPKEGEAMIEPEKQSRYRTGTGMLMFLIKHSRPDIMNSVRELTKVLGKATIGAYREMQRVIKYVLDTKQKGLKIEPKLSKNGKWFIEAYSDSDWAGDPDDRKSVGSFVIFVCGVPVIWRSKSHKCVSLSSSEAEFYACAETVKEIPFVAQLLLFLDVEVELPVNVWVDNVGAIFMSENVTSSTRTRHMDTRWWFVTNWQEEGLVKVQFVRTANNISDIGTKNVNVDTFERHQVKLLKDKPDEEEEET